VTSPDPASNERLRLAIEVGQLAIRDHDRLFGDAKARDAFPRT